MPPTWMIGPAWAGVKAYRQWRQKRRGIELTVHRAHQVLTTTTTGAPVLGEECYYVGILNTSPERDVVVSHIWFDTEPPVHVHDPALPVRLKYGARWETAAPVSDIPAPPERAPWLARCRVTHSDKVVKSREREDVPPYGTVPRG